MPRDMFQLLVCPPTPSTRRWYTVPVSVMLHIVLLATAIAVPLVATDVLPAPKSMLAFVTPVQAPPAPPPSAPRPRARAATRQLSATADRFAAPAQPPQVIAREPAVDLTFDSGTVRDFVSIPGGTGGDATFVEPPPAPTPVPPQPVHPGGKIRAPTRTKNVLPVYPRLAQTVRVEGDVLIEAVIGPDGRVRETRVLRSIPLLDQAALDAVRAWEYTPTFLNDQPVPVILTVTVRFRLN